MRSSLAKSGKLLSWNVRSVLNTEKLDVVLQYMEDNNICIACLCETWFDAQNGTFTARIKKAGYDIKHANRDGKRGGGVALIYKKLTKLKYGEGSTVK